MNEVTLVLKSTSVLISSLKQAQHEKSLSGKHRESRTAGGRGREREGERERKGGREREGGSKRERDGEE